MMASLATLALALPFFTEGILIEQVSAQGSGCANQNEMVITYNNWQAHVAFDEYYSSDKKTQCVVAVTLDLAGGCTDSWRINNTIYNSLPPNTTAAFNMQVFLDDKALFNDRMQLIGSSEPRTKDLVKAVDSWGRRVCGDKVTFYIQTSFEPKAGDQKLKLTDQQFDVKLFRSPHFIHSGATKETVGFLSVVIVIINSLLGAV